MKTVEMLSGKYGIPLDVMFCKGCRAHDGRIPLKKHVFGEEPHCAAHECSKENGCRFCFACDRFPCEHLHPYADLAADLPHHIKVFNLCVSKYPPAEPVALG